MKTRLRFDITDNCNLRCVSCQAYAAKEKGETSFLNYNLFERQTNGQLDDWEELQLGNTAEPTIHPDFDRYVRYIQQQFSGKFHLVTNGTTLKRYASLLNEAPCTVCISLDSMVPENYAKIRRGGDLASILEGIAMLDGSKVDVQVSLTLMRSNIEDFGIARDFCVKNDITLGFQPMVMRPFGPGMFELAHVLENLAFYPEAIESWETEFADLIGERVKGCELNACDAHRKHMILMADGSALLCFKKWHPGLSKASLCDVWNAPEYEAFRSAVDNGRTPCKICTYREQCLSTCTSDVIGYLGKGVAENLSGAALDLLALDSGLSSSERIKTFLTDMWNESNFVQIYKKNGKYRGFSLQKALSIDELPELSNQNDLIDEFQRAAIERVSLREMIEDLNTDFYYEKFRSFVEGKSVRAVVWGTSGGYIDHWAAFVEQNPFGMNIVGLIDSDEAKWGKRLTGLEIYSPDSLTSLKPDLVIVASSYMQDIKRQVKAIMADCPFVTVAGISGNGFLKRSRFA